MKDYTYLASPYSHQDPAVREQRVRDVRRAAAALMLAGESIFCPIAHTHEIGELIGQPADHEFWMRQDLPLLRGASRLKVLALPGWKDSRGVDEEIDTALQIGIRIDVVTLEEVLACATS